MEYLRSYSANIFLFVDFAWKIEIRIPCYLSISKKGKCFWGGIESLKESFWLFSYDDDKSKFLVSRLGTRHQIQLSVLFHQIFSFPEILCLKL